MERDTARGLHRIFFEQINRLHRMFCMQGIFLKMNPGELMMLVRVDRFLALHPGCPGVKPSELTLDGWVSKPAVSKMIGTLEEKGYLIRTASRKDRRVVYVNLTELGRKNLEAERKHRDEDMDRIVKRMGKEKMERLLELLDEFVFCAGAEMSRYPKQKD